MNTRAERLEHRKRESNFPRAGSAKTLPLFVCERKETCDLLLIDPALWSWGCHLVALILTSQSAFCCFSLAILGMFSLGNTKICLQCGGWRTNVISWGKCVFLYLLIHLFRGVFFPSPAASKSVDQPFITALCSLSLSHTHPTLCFPSLRFVDRLRTLPKDGCECKCACVCVGMSVCTVWSMMDVCVAGN